MYFLTMQRDGALGEGRLFASVAEALMAFDRGELSAQAKIKIRLTDIVPPAGFELRANGSILLETTLGRALFNEALPEDYPYADYEVGKKQLGQIVNDLAEQYPKVEVAHCLDQLKDLGFHWATRSGVTVSIGDVSTPADKAEILAPYEDRAVKIDRQYERGLITEDERRQELIEIWTDATSRLGRRWRPTSRKTNPIYMMVHSGARGNMVQMRQIAAMRGLVVNPKGEIIARPIKSNFREGLCVLEYFISTHGGRKGQADTALRTADSGYLTRRLVDVAQDVIIREEDCGTERGPDQDHRQPATTATWCSTSTSRPRSTPGPWPPMCSVRTARCCWRPGSTSATSTSGCWSTPASARSRSAACSPVRRPAAPARCATAGRWPAASWSTSARRSASSRRSPSASRAPS